MRNTIPVMPDIIRMTMGLTILIVKSFTINSKAVIAEKVKKSIVDDFINISIFLHNDFPSDFSLGKWICKRLLCNILRSNCIHL